MGIISCCLVLFILYYFFTHPADHSFGAKQSGIEQSKEQNHKSYTTINAQLRKYVIRLPGCSLK